MSQECRDQLEKVLEPAHHPSIVEISVYLNDSFGNSTRIDYGTGHEMAFVMFLACLFKIGALRTNQDEPAVGLTVFDR
jgi:serine/threonine-protein phosphatase 2A activator